MRKLVLISFIIISQYVICQQPLGIKRVEHIKESTVKILIDGSSVGTGFFISNKGEVLTCFHVVFNERLKIEKNQIKSKLQIVKNDSTILDVFIPEYYRMEGITDARIYDYCLLQVLDRRLQKSDSFLSIGEFKDVNEGDVVVSCGYPHKIEVPFISSGLFSTKWTETFYDLQDQDTVAIPRIVGWLDLTLNPGNSGGPIIVLGNTYQDDKVVGIASFILNPYAKNAVFLKNHAMNARNNIGMNYNGINQIDVNILLSEAIASNSIGISGCISIDYFNKAQKHIASKLWKRIYLLK